MNFDYLSYRCLKDALDNIDKKPITIDAILCHSPAFRELLETNLQGTALENVDIILESGDVIEGSAEKALKKGAKAFLKRPYTPEEMQETLHNVLNTQS